MIWNNEFETLPREALEALQLKRLKNVLERVYETVPFYKKRFDEAGADPYAVRTLDDLTNFPFTYKTDLRDNYPCGLFTVPQDQVVRLHASSGTTGKPTVVGYTQRDVETWSEVMARSLTGAGLGKHDVLQVAFGYGLFTGGLGAHYGGEKIGASVIPASGGNSKRQIMLLKDLNVTGICCTPSYALNLMDIAAELGEDIRDFPIKVGVFGAEPWTDEMRRTVEEGWGIDAIDIYGLSEIIGPGVSCECLEAKRGMHINEDHFLVEVIDPVTGRVLPKGEVGELVFTTITKEAMPLIRYRTRDLSRLITQPCKCGRTFHRMEKVMGRSDDMLIIRGVNVFPSQIESVLVSRKGVLPHYMLIVDRIGTLDTLEVHVEVEGDFFFDEVRKLQELEKTLEKDIKDIIGVTAKIKLVEPKSIARFEGKAQRVIDKRK